MSSDTKGISIVIAQADVPNLVGNIYTKEAIDKMREDLSLSITRGFFGGEIIHDKYEYKNTIDLSKVTHQAKKVDVADGFLMVDIDFMDTPGGELARTLVRSAAGVLRPTIAGHVDQTTREVKVERVISLDIVQYHQDFRLNVTWKKIK